ncbi:MAG: MFS transporter [Phycisphaerales bacterium]
MVLAPHTLRTAWLAVALLWPVALLNYLDRQMLASMKFSVMADIESVGTEANWGLMLGQFKWVYAFLSPLGGLVADRLGRRRTIVASLAAWSAVTWFTGHATTFQELLWTRTLMGFSEAFYIPAALALITDHHTGATRSRAVGVHQMAIVMGTMLGGFGGYAADDPDLGWRWAFHAAGLAGLAYALPLAWLLPVPPQATDAPRCAPAPPVLRSLGQLVTSVPFLLLVVCFTLPALPAWVIRDWMPAILKERFAIGQGQAGVSASLWWSRAAIVGVVLGG